VSLSSDYKRGYAKGYASRGKWPEHIPPLPPDPLVGRLMETAKALRDAIDGELAKFLPDDPLEIALAPKIEAFDDAMIVISKWLKEKASQP
jgi:hypothetical protein